MKHAPLMVLLTLAASSAYGIASAADMAPYPPPPPPPAVAPPPPPPVAVVPPPPTVSPVDERTFRVLDINGDGYISRAEVRQGTHLERMFNQLDVNRDGKLSREELFGLVAIERPGDVANRSR